MSETATPRKPRVVRVAKAAPPEAVAAPRGPAVAVIVPCHGQPHFLNESVASVLAQAPGGPEIGLVVVDDGCPSPETGELGRAFALGDPRIRYLRTRNRGLSGARNLGIDHAFGLWPGLEALYLLDADNRLTANTLATGHAALRADPSLSFVHPQLNKFGITWSGHVDVPTSPIHVLAQGSFIEASSLVHRRVFDAGIRYDETMRDGYEDWEFWLQVAAAGFRGRCLPEMGLDYRYRPESMVRGSARQRPILLDALRRRHRALYRAQSLLALEQEHHPRYGLVTGDAIETLTDPTGPTIRIPREELTERLWRLLAEPERGLLPPYLLFADAAVLAALRAARLAPGILRRLEGACDAGEGRAALVLSSSDETGPCEPSQTAQAAAILVATRRFAEAVAADPGPTDPNPDDPAEGFLAGIARIGLSLAPGWAALPSHPFRAAAMLGDDLLLCREERIGWEAPTRWHWQTLTLPAPEGIVAFLRGEIRGAPLSNVVRGAGRRTLCLVAEAAPSPEAIALAERAVADGLEVHLVLAGRPGAEPPLAAAASVDILELPPAQPSNYRYFGHGFELPPPEDEAWREVRGALAGHDLLAVESPRLYPLLAEIRAQGTRTLVVASGEADAGAENALLAFEHAIDRLVTGSPESAGRLSARGFPDLKIAIAARDHDGLAATFP